MNTRKLLIPAVSTPRGWGVAMDFAPGRGSGFEYLDCKCDAFRRERPWKAALATNEMAIVGSGWNI